MNNLIKKDKKAQEKIVALTQVFILLTSLIAVSYLIGSEFKFVSGADDKVTAPSKETTKAPSDATSTSTSTDSTALSTSGSTKDLFINGVVPPVISSLFGMINLGKTPPNVPIPDLSGADTKPSVTSNVWPVVGKIFEGAVIGATIAAIAGGLAYGLSDGNARFAWNIGWWTLGTYTGINTILSVLIGTGVIPAGNFFASSFSILGLSVSIPALIGAGVAIIGVLIFYRDERTIIVQYTCAKWEAPSGGEGNCEKCNNNANLPCTKYKCESLGASCVLLNEGKGNERCAFIDRNDPSPPSISANEMFLQDNFTYEPRTATLPSNTAQGSSVGVKIKYTGEGADVNGCIPYYKTLKYGISLDKLGRCKADTVRTDNYSSMKYSLSDDTADYNHSITTYFFNSTIEYSLGSIILRSGGEYETHIRCNSSSGAANLATFFFKYCVQNEPDTSAPLIKFKNPETGTPIRKGETSKNITLYIDKPSECKWDRTAFSDINQMANSMTCQSNPTSIDGVNLVYECRTTLTGLLDEQENKYYFLCKSYPNKNESERYANSQAIEYTLIGTKDLVIQELTPKQDSLIRGSTQFVNVSVDVTTFGGYDNGKALCSLKNANDEGDNYQLFATTNSNTHKQMLWLESGSYSYNINCCDAGLNCDEKTIDFEVESDFLAPLVVRISNELKGTNQLKLTTNEKAECVYSITDCTYNFAEGNKFTSEDQINHFAEWNTDNTFYVKCRDEFTNQPLTDQCSVIVRPFNSH